MSLIKRILLTSLLACVIASISGIVAWYEIQQISRVSLKISEHTLPAVARASDLKISIAAIRQSEMKLMLHAKEPAKVQEAKDAIESSMADLTINMRTFEKLDRSSAVQTRYGEIKELWASYIAFNEEFTEFITQGDITHAQELMTKEGDELVSALEDKFGELNDTIYDEAIVLKDDSSRIVKEAVILISSIIPIALLIGGLLSTLMGRRIGRQVGHIAESLNSEFEVVSKAADDIGEMSVQMTDAAHKQETALTQIVTAVDEINSTVSQNAENAKRTNDVSLKSGEAAAEGKRTTEAMLSAIEDIVKMNQTTIDKVETSNREMNDIARVIAELSEKTPVINDIAFQTKILSFNASVEAARAGEQGKGFAVVAEEVGNLASLSDSAAKEITQMLESSVAKVSSVTQNMQDSVSSIVSESKGKIDAGRSTAIACADSLTRIESNISSVVQMVSEIARASQEQAVGVEQVSKAMAHLNEITQAYVTVAQNSGNASRVLTERKELFHTIVRDLTVIVGGTKAGLKADLKAAEAATNAEQVQGEEPSAEVAVSAAAAKQAS